MLPRAHTRVRPYGKIMSSKYKYHREQTYFIDIFFLHDNNSTLQTPHSTLINASEPEAICLRLCFNCYLRLPYAPGGQRPAAHEKP